MYFDNSATTLHKPKAVSDKIIEVLNSDKYGNPSRGGHRISQNSMMAIFNTKKEIADLFHIDNPSDIALTENCSFGLNFVIESLIDKDCHVITTVTEHNSVLRPLYQSGASLSFLDFDDEFNLKYDDLDDLMRDNTRFLVTNEASNILANVNDLDLLHDFAKKNNLIMIIDMAQSAGIIDTDISKYDNSIFVFTGHKSLYGPSGTGGIIKNGDFDFKQVFSGGSGINSFSKTHVLSFPQIFEIGTSNFLSQIALAEGVKYIKEIGIDNIYNKLKNLTKSFYEGIMDIPAIKFYSKYPKGDFTPIVSFNIDDIDSSEISLILDDEYDIQTRPSSHCAPLIHEHFKTERQGIVRFSFSYFNELEEIEKAVEIVKEIANRYK